MPLISLYPGENLLHIACYINNDMSYAYDSDYVLPMHRWTNLEIGQTFLRDQFVYYIKINGKQVFSIINYYPMDFVNMMVYGNDPWSEMPNAKLRNLHFSTSWGPNLVSILEPYKGGNKYKSGEFDDISGTRAPVDGRIGWSDKTTIAPVTEVSDNE